MYRLCGLRRAIRIRLGCVRAFDFLSDKFFPCRDHITYIQQSCYMNIMQVESEPLTVNILLYYLFENKWRGFESSKGQERVRLIKDWLLEKRISQHDLSS